MSFLKLPSRTTKPRHFGITSIVDFGLPYGELQNLLKDYHQIMDLAKIGIGTAYVTPNIESKLSLYKSFHVTPYLGGTFFEKCYFKDQLDEFFTYLKQLGMEWLEISAGVIDIPLEERLRLVTEWKDEFYVIGEVGSKDGEKDMPLSEWNEELQALIEAGCSYVTTEGRSSGTAGIYRSNGEVKADLITEMIENLDPKKVIFEAPAAQQQMFFINQLGANVNLGNVKIHDALLLEAQRSGLRNETFFMENSLWKLPL